MNWTVPPAAAARCRIEASPSPPPCTPGPAGPGSAVERYPGWGGYGAAKAALEQASAVLAAEEPSIRVWWADPGDLRTQLHQAAYPGQDISDRPEPETVVPGFGKLISQRLPSGRYQIGELL